MGNKKKSSGKLIPWLTGIGIVLFFTLIFVLPMTCDNIIEKRTRQAEVLIKAVEDDNLKYIEIMLSQGADINARGNYKRTALIVASRYGLEDMVDLLLANGAKVNLGQDDGMTALFNAVSIGNDYIVKKLIDHGADINPGRNSSGSTPLIMAISGGHDDIANYLIVNGANVNARDNNRQTPLMHAASLDAVETIHMLLKRDVKLDSIDKQNKRSAVMWAAEQGHSKSVIIMVEAGALITGTDKYGMNCMVLAAYAHNLDLVEYFKAHGLQFDLKFDGVTEQMIMQAVSGTRGTYLLQVLFEIHNFPSIDYLNKALREAVDGDLIDHIRFLISVGADLNDRDSGYPLYVYARKGDVEMVKFLLENGAEINHSPNRYSSLNEILWSIRPNNESKYLPVIKLLLENGSGYDNRVASVVRAYKCYRVARLLEQYR